MQNFYLDETQIEKETNVLELDDLELFGEDDKDDEIWKNIQNNNIEELQKQLFVYEGIAPKSDQVLCLKAIIGYLKKDNKAKNLMLEVLKNVDYTNKKYFEFLIFIADKLKEFYSDKKTLLSIDSHIIQATLYYHNEICFYDIFKIVCKSGFGLIQNLNLTIGEKKDIYIILFHFLNDFDYSKLNKDDYQIYLKYYTRILWILRDEFPDLAKQIFSPLFEGIIYQSMKLNSNEEKVKKLLLFGIDEAVAREIVKLLKG